MTGLYLRKYLKDDPSFTPDEGKSDQPFILMRYAEVMLNAAEAAVELALAGEPSPDGSDLMQVATDAVNEIRERAGAELLESNIQPTTEGRNIVRKERRKELASSTRPSGTSAAGEYGTTRAATASGARRATRTPTATTPATVSAGSIPSSRPRPGSGSSTPTSTGYRASPRRSAYWTTTSPSRAAR